MESELIQKIQVLGKITRKVYTSPTLKVYGKVGELTAGTNCKTGRHPVCGPKGKICICVKD
jgi:hypothetical protein